LIIQNFLDLDTAYLLGLIVMRGTLVETGGDHRIVISFPSKSLLATGINLRYDQKKYLRLGANQIRDRLSELLAGDIQIKETRKDVQFIARFLGNNMVWRNLRYILGDYSSYKEFRVPQSIIGAPAEFKREFMRGIADAGGFIRDANNYMGGKRRVYLEVNNRNWILPVQLCQILQKDLSVPVQLIQWGHPNTRSPSVTLGTAWAKEHQIKIFAEHFLAVGFCIDYKQKILMEFAEADKLIGKTRLPPFCNPNPRVRRISKKPTHPGESSDYIPQQIRGKHFDAYWQICLALGCQQCDDVAQKQLFEVDHQTET
jgi:hypothetical protein